MAEHALITSRRSPQPTGALAGRRRFAAGLFFQSSLKAGAGDGLSTNGSLPFVDKAPDPRTIRRALDVLLRLPAEALAVVAERLVDRLDAMSPDVDLEAEEDFCEAEDIIVMFRGWP